MRLVELSPQTQQLIAKKMQDEIQAANMKEVRVRVVNATFWLEGVVTSEGQKAQAMEIATGFLPDRFLDLYTASDRVQQIKRTPIKDFISVNQQKQKEPLPKLIKVTAQFVELAKDYNKIFGFHWGPTLDSGGGSIQFGKMSDGSVSTRSQGTLAGVISNLFPKLGTAQSAGYARVLQAASVITKTGVAASISKEATYPFSTGSGEFTRGEFSKTGLTFKVTPTLKDDEFIELKNEVTIAVTGGTTLEGKPTDIKNMINNELLVKSKETAVLGGIVFSENKTDYDKNSPDKNLEKSKDQAAGTPLFSFLKSKGFSSNKSQFVVFITPEVIESASTGVEEIRRSFKVRRRE